MATVNTLDLVKIAYSHAREDVKSDDGVELPLWEHLPDGYRAAFIHMFTAARWSSEKLGYELKARRGDDC